MRGTRSVRGMAIVMAAIVCGPVIAARAGAQETAVAALPRAATAIADGRAVRPAQMEAQRRTTPIAIDGQIGAEEWAAAAPHGGFVQRQPTPGEAASQRTEARVQFDDGALYVALRLHDTAPDSLLAPLGRRDYTGTSDWAHVVIDSYHDGRTAFWFGVNPAGVKLDGIVSGDREHSLDISWDPVWEAAATRDSGGWSVEMRIPLSQLRFASGGEAWGIQFGRDIARTGERVFWAPILPAVDGFVSRFGTIRGFGDLAPTRRVEVLPYAKASVRSAPAAAGDPFASGTALESTVGADLRLGLTSDLTLSATINPDFGQVEADPSEVNLTAIETLFSERRPFFIEGNDIFSLGIMDAAGFFGRELLFYSRRIGRTPQGSVPGAAAWAEAPDAARILAAAKVSGKTAAGWSLGALGALTGAERSRYQLADGTGGSALLEPRTSYAMLRTMKDHDGGNLILGAAATAVHRDPADAAALRLHDQAYTGGLTLRQRFGGGNWTWKAHVIGSTVSGSPEAITATQRNPVHFRQRPDAAHLGVDSAATRLSGLSLEAAFAKFAGSNWRTGASVRAVTSGFEVNDLGFNHRTDNATYATWLGYEQYQPGRLFRRWSAWTNTWGAFDLGGTRQLSGANVWTQGTLHNEWRLQADGGVELHGRNPKALRGGPALFTPFTRWAGVTVTSDPRRVLNTELTLRTSRFETGGSVMVSPATTLRASDRLHITLAPTFNRTEVPVQYVAQRTDDAGARRYVTGELTQTTAALVARVSYTFTPTTTFQLYAQPFLSAGDYRRLAEVRQALAHRLEDRVETLGDDVLTYDAAADRYAVDHTGDGTPDYTFSNPDFTFGEFRANAVFRWEYRPGSTLFLVWSQQRALAAPDGRFDLSGDARELFGERGTNVFLVKLSHWLGR